MKCFYVSIQLAVYIFYKYQAGNPNSLFRMVKTSGDYLLNSGAKIGYNNFHNKYYISSYSADMSDLKAIGIKTVKCNHCEREYLHLVNHHYIKPNKGIYYCSNNCFLCH